MRVFLDTNILISALILLEMINAGTTLVRPDWVRFHWLMRIVGNVGNLIVAYFLITRGNPVVMVSLGGTLPNAAHVAQIVNQTISFCVWFAVITIIVQLAKNTIVGRKTFAPRESSPKNGSTNINPTGMSVGIRQPSISRSRTQCVSSPMLPYQITRYWPKVR